MKKGIFKKSRMALLLATSVLSINAFAVLTPYESNQSRQTYGLQPIIESIGTVIFKYKTDVPYEASKNNNAKTEPQVGDTLYVPVDVLESVKAKFAEAYTPQIYTFNDWDGDIEDAKNIAYEVKWYVLEADDTATTLDGKTPEQTNVFANDFGVPFILAPEALGKKVAFRITPRTTNGLPNIGQPLDVMDISKLAGQKYPEDGNGNPDPTQPPVIDETKPGIDNPNIDKPVVEIGSERYDVAVYNEKNERLDNASAVIPYVNSTYHVVVRRINATNDGYEDVTNNDEIKNNLVWTMHRVDPVTGTSLVVNTGIATDAAGDETELNTLRQQPEFVVRIAQDGDQISARLGDDTTTFKTQLKNVNALYKGEPHFSEQGLQLKVVLIADNGESAEAAASRR